MPDAPPNDLMPLEIIRRADEPKKKCTAMLLADHPTVRLFHFPHLEGFDPEGKWVLAVDGEPLDEAIRTAPERPRGIVVVDTLWVKAPRLLEQLPPMPHRSLPAGWVTAYPRRSKLRDDPSGGLATNEAAYIARLLSGVDDRSVLDGYYFADRFFAENEERIRAVGARRPGAPH